MPPREHVRAPNASRLSGGQTRPPGAQLFHYLILDIQAPQPRLARRCRRWLGGPVATACAKSLALPQWLLGAPDLNRMPRTESLRQFNPVLVTGAANIEVLLVRHVDDHTPT